MPRIITTFWANRRRVSLAGLLVLVGVAVLLVAPGVGSGGTLNTAQLDDGTCGHDLQLGSDITASSSATPWFLIYGDGSRASYQVFIDGTSIGTFGSDMFANVCVSDTVHLSDGSHTLTAHELAPNSANSVAPFTFTVDTVPPAAPSTPVMASFSDSGVIGDNTTMFPNPSLSGTAQAGTSILYYDGGSPGYGGTITNASGQWSAKTVNLANGVHSLTAVAQDEAGNLSTPSPALQLTIDSTHPTVSITNPAPNATVAGTVNLTANASDNLAVWKVAFQIDGTTLATDTASPYAFSWNSATVADGTHTLTTIATDTAGNTTTTSETITVQNSGSATAPSAPTLTSATPGNGSVALAWSVPSSNGGSTITGYRVYRGTTSGTETLLTTLGNVTAWTDTSLGNGTTYYYKVSALNSAGESVASNELSAMPVTTPGAPTLTSAVPGNSVTLTWAAPGNTGGAGITAYKVYRGTASGGETLLTTVGNVTTYTDETTTYGTTYYYEVSAVTAAGEGSRSNEMSATPVVAPSAPLLNTASAGNGSVALGWSAPSSNGGAAVTGYKIYRGTTSGGETLLTTLGNVTSWTDSSVTNGTTYYYEISAVNSVGESVTSNEMSTSPSASTPSAPTLSGATAGNGSVVLAWSAPASNGGAAVTGYKIYRGTSSGGETLLTTLGNVTSWTDSNVTDGTAYYYKVSAVNSAGEGVASNEMSATPFAVAPGAPTLNSATAGNSSVVLAWSAPSSNGGAALTGYKVYRGTTSGGETLLTTLGNITSWTDSNVTDGTTYYYKVSAVNSAGEGVASVEKSATPFAVAPSAPTLNSATAGNGSIGLAWSAPSSNGGAAVTGYKVYRGSTSGGETLLTTLGNVTSWTDSSVTDGTTYYYKVSALNSAGEGTASNEMSATPFAVAPGAPTLSSASAGNTSVALAWSAPASNGGSAVTGYKVYRGTSSGGETLLTTLGNVTSWTDSNVSDGTAYYYKVSAVNSVGEGATSNEMSATPFAVAPSAPTLNSATAGNGSVGLAWSAPSSNGGAAVAGYKVYRGTTSGGETLLTTLGNVTSWTDSGVTNGTTYFYKVSAVNSAGEGTASNELSATPAASATIPGAPTLNSANAGNGSVALAWSAPASNGGSAITGYKVYRGTTSGGETLRATLGNVTSWADSGATNGTTYFYVVSAVNAVGESVGSNELSATPSAPLSVPGAPTLNSAAAGNGSVALGWSAPASNGGSAITAYKVYRGTTSGAETLLTTLGNVTSWTDSGATNGTTYYYKVTAVNSVGEGAGSNELSATPATVAGAPTLNSANAGGGSVALAWSGPSSNGGSAITGYKVYRGTSSGGETLLTTLGTVTSWTDTGAANGTTYYYEVTAVNGAGESAKSNELSATPASAPGAPTLNSATAGNGTVALAWSAPSSNGGSAVTGYRVYRGTSSGGETLLTTLGNVTSWTDTGAANGTTYYYKVSALNAVGEGLASNERSATPAAATAPGAPTLSSVTAGRHGFGLTWTAPSSNGGSAITGYTVYRGTTSGGETLLATVGNVTSWTDTSASSGTYFYEVTAVNAIGESSRSNELSTASTRKGHK